MKKFITLLYFFLFVFLFSSSSASVWQREAADSSGNEKGSYCSLAIDSNSNPHIAYFDDEFDDLRYAYFNNGIWTVEIVDSIGDAGRECSMALDSQNRPHISYQQRYLGYYWSLKYATLSDTGWIKIIVETSQDTSIGNIGEWSSIAIRSDGYPCISYLHDNPDKIKYAYKDVNGWHLMDVTDARLPRYNKLKLANDDTPIIGYHQLDNQNNNKLEIAYLNPSDSSWRIIVLPDTVERFSYGHLVGFDIDSQNNAYYAYLNADDDLQLAVYDGQNWNIETILVYPYFGGRPSFSLKIDNTDRPCLATFQSEIYFYRQNNGQWESSMVDDGVSPGWYCSLAFDSFNYPRIAAYARTLDYTRDALFYYRYWPGDPQIVLPEISHDFGTVWTQSYSDWNCPVENQGDAPLSINELEFYTNWTDTTFQLFNTPLPKTILPQQTGYINLRFKPQADITYFDTLTIFSNDSLHLQKQISIQGTGTTSGTNGDLNLTIKNVYIDHQHQLLKDDIPLLGATTSLLQNSQVVYGPTQTNQNGQVIFPTIALGNYDLKIETQISIPGDTPGSTILDNLQLTKSIEIGPGSNSNTVIFPESLMVEKYQHVYNLTHIEKTDWGYPATFSYPSEANVKNLLDSWKMDLPPDMQASIGRLIISEDMTYQMFDGGFSIGNEFMKDVGELVNLVMYSENWGTSITEILIDIVWGIITGDWTALLIDILMEVLQEFLQDMLLNIITEGIQMVSAEIGYPGEGIINGAWNVVKNNFSGWSFGGFSQSVWNDMAGEIYNELKQPVFQEVYVNLLTDSKIDAARVYSENFNYNGDFRDAYDNSTNFISHKLADIQNDQSVCANLRITANLFNITANILNVLSQWIPAAYVEIIEAISISMQIAAYVEVVTAMGISGYTFFTLPEKIGDTVDKIYFPNGKPASNFLKSPPVFQKTKANPQVIAMIKKNIYQSNTEYDSVLADIISLVSAGDAKNAILELDNLMLAESNLRNNLKSSSAPIYAVAKIAKDSITSFSGMYDSLKYKFAHAGEARYKNYIFTAFAITDTSQEMKNSVMNQLESSSNLNHILVDQISNTLDTVSVLLIPAIIVTNQSSQSEYGIEKGETETILIQLQNVGSLAAENVMLKISTNQAIDVVETDSIYIGTLSPGDKSAEFIWSVEIASSQYRRGMWTTEIYSSNAKTYSSSGSFRIPQDESPSTGGKLTNENIYNYPNPFNPDNETTMLRYSLEKSAKVTIKIYDAGGNIVKTVIDGIQQTATEEQNVMWDGKNGDGDVVANGVYFFVIETSANERVVGKIAVLR